jgi:hypothetical protein
MNDLNEQSLLDVLTKSRSLDTIELRKPCLIISEKELIWQAMNYRDGVITEADMKSIGVPQEAIDIVKDLAREMT